MPYASQERTSAGERAELVQRCERGAGELRALQLEHGRLRAAVSAEGRSALAIQQAQRMTDLQGTPLRQWVRF